MHQSRETFAQTNDIAMFIPLKDDNPTRGAPVLTVAILLVNVGVFVYSKFLGVVGFDVFTASLGVIPFEIVHGVDAISPTPIPLYLTLLTTMFMHGGWLHLGSNMLYLWIFANNVEDSLAHVRFLGFYLFCGIAATLAHVAAAPQSLAPLVGASGAIAGVLGAYTAAFPGARVHVWMFPFILFQVPAAIVLGLWFVLQLVNAWMDQGGAYGGIAWYAHIAGFVVGFILMRRQVRRLKFVNVM